MYEVLTRTSRRSHRRDIADDGAVVIHTGLSVVTACGATIDIVRDDVAKVAIVRVSEQANHLKAAADILASRAERFLGREWTVVRWCPPPAPSKTAGYISQGSGA